MQTTLQKRQVGHPSSIPFNYLASRQSRHLAVAKSRSWVRVVGMIGLSIAVMLVGDPVTHVNAQDPPAAGGLEIADLTGALQALQGNQIKIKAEDSQEYMLIVDDKTTLKYSGTADLRFLSPGLLVRFTAPFDQAGNAQRAVSDLEVFTIVRSRRMSREQLEQQTPGIYPLTNVDGAKNEARGGAAEKAANRPAQGAAASKQANKRASGSQQTRQSDQHQRSPAIQTMRVVGQLRTMQAGKIQVMAGVRPIIVPLDPMAEIKLFTSDVRFCQMGDAVEVVGLRNAGQPLVIRAQTISITGAKPLGQGDAIRQSRTSKTETEKLDDLPPENAAGDSKTPGKNPK